MSVELDIESQVDTPTLGTVTSSSFGTESQIDTPTLKTVINPAISPETEVASRLSLNIKTASTIRQGSPPRLTASLRVIISSGLIIESVLNKPFLEVSVYA